MVKRGMASAAAFSKDSCEPAVRGFLHSPASPNGDALVLTHGAGSNCSAPLIVALAAAFAESGYAVLRCDLPFRQERRTGPPFPGNADRDRAGLRSAVATIRALVPGNVFLGGHSYGGRQSSMLCANEPGLVTGLLLLSYPLHPPRKPEQLRTQHLPTLWTTSLFVHGTRDPFGSIEELEKALMLIPATKELFAVDGAGHDLGFKGKQQAQALPARVVAAFAALFESKT